MTRTRKRPRPEERLEVQSRGVSLGAMGIESEFTVLLDGRAVKPEDVFQTPTNIVREKMLHRTGRSYHLPTGGALYFDTGVIELATDAGREDQETVGASSAARDT